MEMVLIERVRVIEQVPDTCSILAQNESPVPYYMYSTGLSFWEGALRAYRPLKTV